MIRPSPLDDVERVLAPGLGDEHGLRELADLFEPHAAVAVARGLPRLAWLRAASLGRSTTGGPETSGSSFSPQPGDEKGQRDQATQR